MSNEKLSNNHDTKTRLCHIKKVENFDGYGFNLHAEKGKVGQYIGKVDEGSPAESAGLRQGDRILEVNGESIANKTHKQVVEMIKQNSDETKLLVAVEDDEPDTIIPTEPTKQNHQENNVNNGVKQENNINNHNMSPVKKDVKEQNGKLNLTMTAAELRAKLANKKKFDPKKEAMDFKQKFDIVQKL